MARQTSLARYVARRDRQNRSGPSAASGAHELRSWRGAERTQSQEASRGSKRACAYTAPQMGPLPVWDEKRDPRESFMVRQLLAFALHEGRRSEWQSGKGKDARPIGPAGLTCGKYRSDRQRDRSARRGRWNDPRLRSADHVRPGRSGYHVVGPRRCGTYAAKGGCEGFGISVRRLQDTVKGRSVPRPALYRTILRLTRANVLEFGGRAVVKEEP